LPLAGSERLLGKKGDAAVKKYYDNINFNCTDPNGCIEKIYKNRRYDIADLDRNVALEIKAYESEKVYLSSKHIKEQVEQDIANAKEGLNITWVFEGCLPDKNLENALKNAKINIIKR
jgi:hypothetical protein